MPFSNSIRFVNYKHDHFLSLKVLSVSLEMSWWSRFLRNSVRNPWWSNLRLFRLEFLVLISKLKITLCKTYEVTLSFSRCIRSLNDGVAVAMLGGLHLLISKYMACLLVVFVAVVFSLARNNCNYQNFEDFEDRAFMNEICWEATLVPLYWEKGTGIKTNRRRYKIWKINLIYRCKYKVYRFSAC